MVKRNIHNARKTQLVQLEERTQRKTLQWSIFFLLLISGCSYTKLPENQDSSPRDDSYDAINNFQPEGDSVCLSGYYYRFNFNDFPNQQVSADWILGNLEHFNISFQDAWYIASDNPNVGKPYDTGTIRGPSMLVLLNPDNPNILDHHFVKCLPRKLTTMLGHWTHYYPSQAK